MKLKTIICVLGALLLSVSSAFADGKCSKCGGTGRVVIFSGKVASYGTMTYRKCPVCGETRDTNVRHTHKCSQCNGYGYIHSGGSTGGKSSHYSGGGGEFMTVLSADEYNYFQSLVQQLHFGKDVWVNCSSCHGTGKCPSCGGAWTYDINTGTSCFACMGAGYCRACNGNAQFKRKEQLTGAERERAQAEVDRLAKKAMARLR